MLDNYEIRPGRFIGVCLSLNNCRLFIGSIPEVMSKHDIMKVMTQVGTAAASLGRPPLTVVSEQKLWARRGCLIHVTEEWRQTGSRSVVSENSDSNSGTTAGRAESDWNVERSAFWGGSAFRNPQNTQWRAPTGTLWMIFGTPSPSVL